MRFDHHRYLAAFKMVVFSYIGKKLEKLCSCLASSLKFMCFLVDCIYCYAVRLMNPFSIELFYILLVSCVGFVILNAMHPRTEKFTPRKLDLFFTSVSATTVSSMSVVEMEVFSNAQLIILTMIMFISGKVFTSMVAIFVQYKVDRRANGSTRDLDNPPGFQDHNLELGAIANPEFRSSKSDVLDVLDLNNKSIKFLGLLVLGYLFFVQTLGVISVYVYLNVISSAKSVLKQKGLNTFTFSLFTIVSTFASCGFVPTNENMMVFSKNSGLLLLLVPQILLGSNLYPSVLRFCIWIIGKIKKKEESITNYLLNNGQDICRFHDHFLSHMQSIFLVVTVLVFILIQFLFFSIFEWNSDSLTGMNDYQKFIGAVFQAINTRHTGETIFNLSTVDAASLVLIVAMMYLPPYISFLPLSTKVSNTIKSDKSKKRCLLENIVFSQLLYVIVFIILVCITERRNIKADPLNFSVLNIVVEVISAYGNVGFTTGYSCGLQLKPDEICENKSYGFAGKWSDTGKLILIVVMFFGRLKKFT
ncbi:hypothetical protein R6Q59_032975 [Mikania micrantha]